MDNTAKRSCTEPAEAAKKVIEMFGEEVLSDHRRFCAAFSDIAPKLSKENKAFFVALSENTGKIYLEARSDISSGKATPDEINKRAFSVISEYLNKEKADMIVASLSYALGWETTVSTPEITTEADTNTIISGTVTEDLFRRAEEGDCDAQFNLAERFYYGRGVKQSYTRAVEWFSKAAEAGDCASQKRLADCYHSGQGVDIDYTKAVHWYYQAAEQGDYDSQKALILLMNTGGHNLIKDRDRARKLSARYDIPITDNKALDELSEGVMSGVPEAQYELAVKMYLGDSVPCDKAEAVKLFRLAAEQNHADAQFNLAKCLADGDGTERNPAEAFEWYNKSYENGSTDALNNLAGCYFNGSGAPKSQQKAAELYRKAAELGNARAQYNYGECCYNGWGVKQDYYEAANWYAKSAALGNSDAQYSLGWCHCNGIGVIRDCNAAKRLFELSALQRNPHAQLSLAYCYLNGQGTEKNYARAADWFGKAASRGITEGARMLVKCLATGGYYLAKDTEKARKIAEKYGVELQTL